MKRIVFFLKNKFIPDIDYTNVCIANPGVGGTEYLFVLTAYILSRRKEFDIILYAQKPSIFPEGLQVDYTENVGTGIQKAAKENADIFICREDPAWIKRGYLDNIPKGLKVILWAHNFMKTERLDYYVNNNGIYSVVCVGREQLDMYTDHRFFKKMDYIYNANAFSRPDVINHETIPVKRRKNIVTYIGALQPYKGFHILAKAWPKILKAVPDAELYVIGSGRVYDNNAPMGKYNIASEEYERIFMPSLTDKEGKILPSVHFMGRMGTEKNDIIKQTKVGVPNPSGKTETFGLGAVEFQGLGCCVVTKKCPGYVDTVINTENLYKSNRQIADYVIRNLRNPSFDYGSTYETLYSKFHFNSVASEWTKYLNVAIQGCYRIHDIENQRPNYWWNLKWLRVWNRNLNRILGYPLPPIQKFFENRLINKISWHVNQIIEKYE